MKQQLNHLFTPLRIGSMQVPNRIVMTAHTTYYAENGLLSERHINYFAERAKGGVGLIVGEPQVVHPTGWHMALQSKTCAGYKDDVVPIYQRLADAVHQHGAKIVMQLMHDGIHTDGEADFDEWHAPQGPSAIPGVKTRNIAKAMTAEDIQEIIEGYARTARNVQKGNLDGVEVHAAHYYLPAQFMSPLYNKRGDEYGSNLDNRLRFTLQVLQNIRDSCGKDFVVGIRLNGDELFAGGNDLEDTKEIALRLEASGLLDYLSISIGCANVGYVFTPTMVVPPGYQVYLAAAIKGTVKNIPVFTVGRINDPLMAEKIIADGQADMVGMTRANICDPEMPTKAREGRFDDIRHCVACNQRCVGSITRGRPMTCVQNPSVGREPTWGIGSLRPASSKKTVMVVGGGPAGMEAARVAAMRGHRVKLYESTQQLGGQVSLAAKAPTRSEFGEIARFLARQMDRLKVEVHLGTEVGTELVKKENPDVLIIATGSRPQRNGSTSRQPSGPGILGTDQKNVLVVWDVLQERAKIGGKVVLIDEDGGQRPFFTAEFLADRGAKVEIVTPYLFVGADLPFSHEIDANYARLLNKGVVFTPSTAVSEIKGDTVLAYNVYTKEERKIENVDTVVLAMSYSPNNELYNALSEWKKDVHAIGDCVSPRTVAAAIYEGHKVGRSI